MSTSKSMHVSEKLLRNFQPGTDDFGDTSIIFVHIYLHSTSKGKYEMLDLNVKYFMPDFFSRSEILKVLTK